jgi:hypothetical protein
VIPALIAVLVVGALYVGARSADSLAGRRPRRARRDTDRSGDGGWQPGFADGGQAGDDGCGGDGGGGCD